MSTTDLLLAIIDQAYDRQSWHGTNLRGSIRRLDAADAIWRPGPGRHNVAEIVVHAAYWKYAVLRRLLGMKRGSFPLKGSNWFVREAPYDELAWRADVSLLDGMHGDLRHAIAAFDAKLLGAKSAGSKFGNLKLITGIAAHDVYHAGQIQTIKALLKGSEM